MTKKPITNALNDKEKSTTRAIAEITKKEGRSSYS
jgi:hypothetical protein